MAEWTRSSIFAAAFRSGFKLIEGARVGSFLYFHSVFLSYLLREQAHSSWVSAGVIKPADECHGFERGGHEWPR